jgi:hypothetical protein
MNIKHRNFFATPDEKKNGEQDMSKAEILKALELYKVQNPAKYEAKKEALMARYGLTEKDIK